MLTAITCNSRRNDRRRGGCRDGSPIRKLSKPNSPIPHVPVNVVILQKGSADHLTIAIIRVDQHLTLGRVVIKWPETKLLTRYGDIEGLLILVE
jgi:hypothetical protein